MKKQSDEIILNSDFDDDYPDSPKQVLESSLLRYGKDCKKAQEIVASRKVALKDFDTEYFDAVLTLSYRVDCPFCRAKKYQVCRGAVEPLRPAHRDRLKLLHFDNPKVLENLKYAYCSTKKWY